MRIIIYNSNNNSNNSNNNSNSSYNNNNSGNNNNGQSTAYLTVVRKGLIVRGPSGKHQIIDKTPSHIADTQSMTEDFTRLLRKKRPCSHDGDTSDVASTVARKITRPAKSETLPGGEISPCHGLGSAERARILGSAERNVRKKC